MDGIAIEYPVANGRAALVAQPGYRRRLALQADGWRRAVDLVLYDSPEAARAALDSDAWRALTSVHPACHAAAPALLVSACPYGGPVVLLRSSPGPTRGGQACWRDHLAGAEPEAVLWRAPDPPATTAPTHHRQEVPWTRSPAAPPRPTPAPRAGGRSCPSAWSSSRCWSTPAPSARSPSRSPATSASPSR